MRRRAWTGLVVGAMALAACGVQNDATPRNIIDDSGVASGDTATDAGDTSEAPYRIFLLSPQSPSQLRGVRRNVSTTLRGLFEALLQGPTESDRDARLRTAIPSDLELVSPPRALGMFVYLDVNDALYSLSGSTLVDALAQIVFTMVELPEVSGVQLLVDGEPQEWPTGDGSLSASELTPFDFPERNPSVQPAYPNPLPPPPKPA